MLDFIKNLYDILITTIKGGVGISYKLTSPLGEVSFICGTIHLAGKGVPLRYLINAIRVGFRMGFESNINPASMYRVMRAVGTPQHDASLLANKRLLAAYNTAYSACMKALSGIGGVQMDMMLSTLDKGYTQLESFEGYVDAMQSVMAANVETATFTVNYPQECGIRDVHLMSAALAAGDLEGLATLTAKYPSTDRCKESIVTRNYHQAMRLMVATAERGGICAFVGGMHLHGPDGVPAILAREGWKVERQ